MTILAELKVENSSIEVGGRARINEKVMKDAGLENGELLVISSEKKDVLVSAYYDEMIDEDNISLRGKDREKLKVSEGEEVKVKEHTSLLQKLL